MADMIKDGSGKGYMAKVDSANRLLTRSKNDAIQHSISMEDQGSYQAIGYADLSAGTVVGLHIKNEDSTKFMVVTYLRHQLIEPSGGTEFPNVDNYYRISIGSTYVSGGSVVSPVNVFAGSGNISNITMYQDNPTVTGDIQEIDRWYEKDAGDMNRFNKEGSLIIPPGQTMQLAYVGDKTSGLLYNRISFLMDSGE